MEKQLNQMNNHVVFHTELVFHIDIFQQVHSIFIFYTKTEDFKYLFHEQLNIIGVYHRLDFFYPALAEQINLIAKQFFQWTLYDQTNFCKRDLSKLSSDFLWMQLFYDAISSFAHDEQAKKDMMNIFRLYANEKSEYQSNDAIQWYLNNSFLQNLITKSLQRKDIDQLYQLRYFLVDLIENFVIHQQVKLSKHELNHFKQKRGQMMSMKGFLLVKQDILLPQRSDLVDVDLEIKCNRKEYQNKKEVLSDLNTTFQLENIEENDQKFLIRLIAVSYGQMIKEKYLTDTHRQIESLSIPIIFNLSWIEYFIGQTFYEIGQLNEARLCYDRAIKSNKINLQDSAVILSAICKVLYSQGKYDQVLEFLQQALEIREKYYEHFHVDIAISLDNISDILIDQTKYDQALEYQKRAMSICREYYQSNHTYMALLLYRTGYILYQQEIIEEALNLNQQALTLMKNLCSSSHPDVLYALTNIAHIRYGQEMYEESLQLYQQV
ncbi:unnamed protein product, partial [Adineta steineri]